MAEDNKTPKDEIAEEKLDKVSGGGGAAAAALAALQGEKMPEIQPEMQIAQTPEPSLVNIPKVP